MGRRREESFAERQRECIFALVRDILSDRSIEAVTFEDVHGALSVRRDTAKARSLDAIGFTVYNQEREDEEDEDEE